MYANAETGGFIATGPPKKMVLCGKHLGAHGLTPHNLAAGLVVAGLVVASVLVACHAHMSSN
jgi:hypothetical protein